MAWHTAAAASGGADKVHERVRPLPSAHGAARSGQDSAMSGWDIAAAVIAAALLVYLVAALLRPEDFS